jgi:Tfp pilus assembly major pilin PilA
MPELNVVAAVAAQQADIAGKWQVQCHKNGTASVALPVTCDSYSCLKV